MEYTEGKEYIFISHVENAKKSCDIIVKELENFFNVSPDNVNWSNVESAAHVSEKLKEICEFLNKGENNNG